MWYSKAANSYNTALTRGGQTRKTNKSLHKEIIEYLVDEIRVVSDKRKSSRPQTQRYNIKKEIDN